MKISYVLLEMLVKKVVGCDWDKVKEAINATATMAQTYYTQGINDEQKIKYAKSVLSDFKSDLRGNLLNFAIEAAVLLAKQRISKQ
jgi:hypothetical protein